MKRMFFVTPTILVALTMMPGFGAVLFDSNATSPDGGTTPGWFNGSGNPNGGFTVVQDNGIEIGLRIKLRQDPNVIHSPDGVYFVPTGPQPGVPARAAWNYEFYILSGVNGSPYNLSQLTNVSLSITNLGTGATNSVNPLTYWNDNSYFGAGGKADGLFSAHMSDWDAQNSENPTFGDFPLFATYNMNEQTVYQFTLNVSSPQGTSSNTVFANTTPEPSSLALGALGIGVLGLARKYRARKA